VFQSGKDDLHAFGDGLGTSGKIDDEGLPGDPTHSPGRQGMRGLFQAFHAHRFGKSRNLAIDDFQGRVWRDISGGKPRSSCGEDKVSFFIDSPKKRFFDLLFFVFLMNLEIY